MRAAFRFKNLMRVTLKNSQIFEVRMRAASNFLRFSKTLDGMNIYLRGGVTDSNLEVQKNQLQ